LSSEDMNIKLRYRPRLRVRLGNEIWPSLKLIS
jgi:hypothetical protein